MSDTQPALDIEYGYRSSDPSHTSAYLQQMVLTSIRAVAAPQAEILDAGCGNGWFSQQLKQAGYSVAAVDSSRSGIEHARRANSDIDFRIASVYDDLATMFNRKFAVVVALEVIEHLYDPRRFLKRAHDIIAGDGILILSTPYHGYLKNIALAVTGKLDSHFTALWDGGHIKFWSRKTLSLLLTSAGFEVIEFRGAGRIPLLWKSMILIARKR
jgi:2-polyprenyl-3-methyl-5-hydroxy-6-metoxy-1,4-benzoquinol methylase